MTIGTKSVLFGAHQFLIHPWFVALGWWTLYGFPWDPRLWVAFFVHDLGYFGKPNMDGDEGETHVELGARIMTAFFDRRPDRNCPVCWGNIYYPPEGGGWIARCGRCHARASTWYDLCLYHSMFYAKKNGQPVSRLCYADKMAIVLTPAWLYIPMTRMTGEIYEYIVRSEQKEGAKYATMVNYATEHRQWYENMRTYMRNWIADERRAGRVDATPQAAA